MDLSSPRTLVFLCLQHSYAQNYVMLFLLGIFIFFNKSSIPSLPKKPLSHYFCYSKLTLQNKGKEGWYPNETRQRNCMKKGVLTLIYKVNNLSVFIFLPKFWLSFFFFFQPKLKNVWNTAYKCTDFAHPYCHLATFPADIIDVVGPSMDVGFRVVLLGE